MPELQEAGAAHLAAFAFAVLFLLVFLNARRNLRAIPSLTRLDESRAADCMVVIPARNEEDVIGRAVLSLPHDSVIVVDDGSTDQTAKIARQAGAGVLPAPPLQRGGTGKANACAAGAQTLKSRWILFADADTHFAAGFLEAAVGEAEARGLSFLSVYPTLESAGFMETLLAPYLQALYFAGINPKLSPAEAFNGQVVLARRETYEFLGGHNAILREAVDDIRLAMLAERHRVRFGVVQAPELCFVRMYRGARGIWSGLERQAVRYHVGSPIRALASLFSAAVAILWLPLLIFLLREGQALAAVTAALTPVAGLRSWYGTWRRALLAPVAIYVALPFLAHAVMIGATGQAVRWKGRKV